MQVGSLYIINSYIHTYTTRKQCVATSSLAGPKAFLVVSGIGSSNVRMEDIYQWWDEEGDNVEVVIMG